MNGQYVSSQKMFLATGLVAPLFLALGLGVIEAGLRLRQWWLYGVSVSVHNFEVDPKSGLRVPSPGEIHGSRISIRINSQGFRGPELDLPKPKSRVRLAYLGASTTFSAEASRDEATWPHLVWSKLRVKYPMVEFDYVNAGVPGYGVEESLRNLEYRVKPLRPDFLMYYEATNDLSYDTRQLAEAQGLSTHQSMNSGWLAEWSLAWFLIEKNLQIVSRQRAAAREQKRLAFEPRELSKRFRRELTKLIRAAKEVAPVVAVATFSYKLRREQTKEQQLRAANTALYYMPYISVDGLLTGYEEYNRVVREVAKETEVILIDDEFLIPADDRHFYDSVHFTDAGNELMATRVVKCVIGSERFVELVGARDPDRNASVGFVGVADRQLVSAGNTSGARVPYPGAAVGSVLLGGFGSGDRTGIGGLPSGEVIRRTDTRKSSAAAQEDPR